MVKSRPGKSAATYVRGTFGRFVGEKGKLLDFVMAEEAPLEVEDHRTSPPLTPLRSRIAASATACRGASPDGKWLAFIRENNVWG